MVKVKICGITNWADAKLAVDAGASALGFNFYPPSPRHVTPRKARDIIRHLPEGIQAVGVFVDAPLAEVQEIADLAGLELVQFHGGESPEAVADFSRHYPVIKAFRVRPGFRPEWVVRYDKAAAFLLDTFSRTLRGGTGKSFDWTVAKRAKRYGRIFLSGGLTPENVARAIREVEPYAIDVASGVESKPGKKDAARLRELMDEVERANRELR